MNVRLVVTGRHYDQAAALPAEISLPDGCSLDEALRAVEAILPEGRLVESCLVAVSGNHLGTRGRHQPRVLREGDELLVLAPVAGG